MFGLSMTEVVIILGLALLLLGPDQLPSIAKTLGKGMREIRKATDDLKSTFEQEMVRLDEPEQQPRRPCRRTPGRPGRPPGARLPGRTPPRRQRRLRPTRPLLQRHLAPDC